MTNCSIECACYSGCGNSFLIFDNRQGSLPEFSGEDIEMLCSSCRCDGLILAENSKEAFLEMRYFNRDGFQAAMCGNGVRALFQFIKKRDPSMPQKCLFATQNGLLPVEVTEKNLIKVAMGKISQDEWDINLEYKDVSYVAHFLNTGVPHLVFVVPKIDDWMLTDMAPFFRFHKRFAPSGTNVNFVTPLENGLFAIRTYERGVEQETLACGTGTCAAAVVLYKKYASSRDLTFITKSTKPLFIKIEEQVDGLYTFLEGEATEICEGVAHTSKSGAYFERNTVS